jgi:hypothetical protein
MPNAENEESIAIEKITILFCMKDPSKRLLKSTKIITCTHFFYNARERISRKHLMFYKKMGSQN